MQVSLKEKEDLITDMKADNEDMVKNYEDSLLEKEEALNSFLTDIEKLNLNCQELNNIINAYDDDLNDKEQQLSKVCFN